MLDLPADQLAFIKKALCHRVPNIKVIAFGSRVSGKPRKYSDLDICIMNLDKTDDHAVMYLKDDLEESDLPIRVDVLNWATLSPEFRKIIESQPQEIIQAGS